MAVIVVAGFILYTPDIAHDELVAKYGGTTSRFLNLPDGSRVHYRDQGNLAAPVIVLLHGTGSSLYTWEGWVQALSGRYRVISLDLPGHGMTGRTATDDYSDAGLQQFLLAFTDKLELRRFVLAGSSWGGGIAARFAINNPKRVSHLVLIDAAGVPFPEEGRKVPIAFQLMGKPVLGDVLAWITPRSVVAEAVRSVYGDPGKVTEERITQYFEMTLHAGNRQAGKMRARVPYAVIPAEELAKIKASTLILWGAKDGLTPLSMGQEFDAGISNSRLRVFENAGHIPMEEIPEESAAVLEKFLQEKH